MNTTSANATAWAYDELKHNRPASTLSLRTLFKASLLVESGLATYSLKLPVIDVDPRHRTVP